MRRLVSFVSGLAIVAVLSPALAHADDKDIIDYRQHIMKTLDEQVGALGEILSTAIPSDNAVAHLDAITLTASIALKAFEPKVQGGTAKPEVWSNWDDFSKRMTAFAQKLQAADKVAHEKGKDEALGTILDALACKDCHQTYKDDTKK